MKSCRLSCGCANRGFAFTLDLLGEAIISEDEADAYLQAYLALIQGLAPTVNRWPQNFQLDCDHRGAIPRVNVSIKLSALYSSSTRSIRGGQPRQSSRA